MGVELLSNQFAVKGDSSSNPFGTEQFFTDIDVSGTISIGLTSGNATIAESGAFNDVLVHTNPYGEIDFSVANAGGGVGGVAVVPSSGLPGSKGEVTPLADGQSNLGSSAFSWNNGWFNGYLEVGGTQISYYRIDPDAGQMDIGSSTSPTAGTGAAGADSTIWAQSGADASGGIGAGQGGKEAIRGGQGGMGDLVSAGGLGGDLDLDGGIGGVDGGAGAGDEGNVRLACNYGTAIIAGANLISSADGGPNWGMDIDGNKVRPDKGYAKTGWYAGDTCALLGDRITLNSTTGDVSSPAIGDVWYNNTTYKLKFRSGSAGGTTVELLDSATGAIPNPGTRNTNDLLQYTAGGAWDAKGGTTGDRLGKIWAGDIDMTGGLTFTADASYDIGASATTNRPRYGYFSDGVQVNNQSFLKGDRLSLYANGSDVGTPGAGDLWYNTTAPAGPRFRDSSATRILLHDNTSHAGDVTGINGTTVVEKVRGYSMTAGAPARGDIWQYGTDGTSAWLHKRDYLRVLAVGSVTSLNSSGWTTVAGYTVNASEFNNNTIFYIVYEVYNPNSLNVEHSIFFTDTEVTNPYRAGGTYTYNMCEFWIWPRQDNNQYVQGFHHHWGGVGASSYGPYGSDWSVNGCTINAKAHLTTSSGTVYVRAFIMAYVKE